MMAEQKRNNPVEYVTVEIYDQLYHLSGQDPEHIRERAAIVDAKMRAVAAHDADVRIARLDDLATEADGRSITALLTLGVAAGDSVRVRATGSGSAAVLDEIRAILGGDGSPAADRPAAGERPAAGDTP